MVGVRRTVYSQEESIVIPYIRRAVLKKGVLDKSSKVPMDCISCKSESRALQSWPVVKEIQKGVDHLGG
jgi:hypothetical protein